MKTNQAPSSTLRRLVIAQSCVLMIATTPSWAQMTQPAAPDAATLAKYDKNKDGTITGSGSGAPTDECILLRPEDNLTPCQERVEHCSTADLMDRRERALEDMEAAVESMENVRAFYQYFAYGQRL